jgi:hypothetical protein
MANGSIEQLLGFGKSDRAVRTYAYLTVAFNTRNDVGDVLDCLLPFVSSVVNRDSGSQPVEIGAVADGLAEFGLKIPVYAVQQLLARLSKRGYLEWNAVAHAYLPTTALAEEAKQAPPLSLSDTFDQLEDAITGFARKLGLDAAPISSTWSDALIAFLRSEGAKEAIRSSLVKEVIIGQPKELETFIIARFVQYTQESNSDLFNDITKVFTGILIEDFISNVQEIGSPGSYKGLNVFYDTAVLLQALGTSGALLQTATLEMHTTLQGLGCNTYYFESNSSEVQNILDTLEGSYSRGREIYGETADAIHLGEITIGEIRDMAGTFETRLGALNIFPFPYIYASRQNEDHFQIDEPAFAAALKSEAIKNERGYSEQNATNDAHVVSLLLRLRRGRSARMISKSNYIFVAKNSSLQRVARNFVAEHVEEYDGGSVPPVMTMTQITTIAWIAATKTLEHLKISRELLASCYAAVQPSEAWAEEFSRVFGKFQEESPEFVAERANSIIFLNTARSTARDESLNQPVVLRKLNIAELFRRAAEADEVATLRHREVLEKQLIEAEQAKNEALAEAARNAASKLLEERHNAEIMGRNSERERLAELTNQRLVRWADTFSKNVVIVIQLTLAIAFAVALFGDLLGISPAHGPARWATIIVLGTLTVLSFLDALGVKFVTGVLQRLRRAISRFVLKILRALFGVVGEIEIKEDPLAH